MDKSEKFWDRAAATYDQEEKKDERTYRKIIQKTKMHLNAGDTVLDYGCGTGTIDLEIARNVKEIQAIDMSSRMIYLAKIKAGEREIDNINYTQASIYDEKLNKDYFNVITAFTVLHLLGDIPAEIKRINELLKPGGLFISSTPCMGGKKFTYIFLSLISKTGLVPEIKPLKFPELKNLITDGNLGILESECLDKRSQQYFIVARKT